MLSFNEQKEFNLLPGPKIKRLPHHKYKVNDFEALKLSAIYGANGAGKSNIINALHFLVEMVTSDEEDSNTYLERFLLDDKAQDKSQMMGVEFIHQNTSFIYGLEVKEETIVSEELYYSGLGKNKDELIFKRAFDKDDYISVIFPQEFEESDSGKTLKSIIEQNLSKPKVPTLRLLKDLNIESLPDILKAYSWFEDGIDILLPGSKPPDFTKDIITDNEFRTFANEMLQAFDTGAKEFDTVSKKAVEFFSESQIHEIKNNIEDVKSDPEKKISIVNVNSGEDAVLENKNGEVYVTRLALKHGNGENSVKFLLNEESDGTKRLIDYIPFFMGIIYEDKTYFVDEIERSIHPLIVKTLVSKFSELENTKGQLIFTTHESNLLDQKIFRSDEIWFVEKNHKGESEFYPLSDFKEHHTIDISKGYLNGRYGAIPFLGNLKDLNWL
jgi:AAA15 family ATPase/GTPase